jgi:hypothetical protein
MSIVWKDVEGKEEGGIEEEEKEEEGTEEKEEEEEGIEEEEKEEEEKEEEGKEEEACKKNWCNVSPSPTDVSPIENSWMLHPLDKVSLNYFAIERTIPSLNSDLIERSDTQLQTVERFSAMKRWSSMCGPSVHSTEGRQSNKPGQGCR